MVEASSTFAHICKTLSQSEAGVLRLRSLEGICATSWAKCTSPSSIRRCCSGCCIYRLASRSGRWVPELQHDRQGHCWFMFNFRELNNTLERVYLVKGNQAVLETVLGKESDYYFQTWLYFIQLAVHLRWIHTFHDHRVLRPDHFPHGLCVRLIPYPDQAEDHLSIFCRSFFPNILAKVK